MANIQGYVIDLTDSEFDYLENLENACKRREALNSMLINRFAMGREYGKAITRSELLENICEAISNL